MSKQAENITIDEIRTVAEPIFRDADARTVGIFGSFLRGQAGADSDIDFLVDFDTPKSLLEIVRLERTLKERLGRPVDVVTENALSPYFKDSVLNDLQVLYEQR